MQRRSFLSLVLAAPMVPALAKLQAVIAPPPLAATPIAESAALSRAVQRYITSFTSDVLEPGRIGLAEVYLQRLFLPDRLIVTEDSCAFDILNVSAGGEAEIDQAVPAAVFSALAWGTRLQFAPVHPGSRIVMAVHNRDTVPLRFTAAFIGSTVE